MSAEASIEMADIRDCRLAGWSVDARIAEANNDRLPIGCLTALRVGTANSY